MFKIFFEEINQMASNGMILTCAGMMDGQLIVFTDPQGDFSTIMFVVMASNPDSSVERVYNIFQNLVHDKFSNYILNIQSVILIVYISFIFDCKNMLNIPRRLFVKNVLKQHFYLITLLIKYSRTNSSWGPPL